MSHSDSRKQHISLMFEEFPWFNKEKEKSSMKVGKNWGKIVYSIVNADDFKPIKGGPI